MNLSSGGFVNGGGEMGERIRNLDWSKTSVGSKDTWPQSLRTILSVILNSKFPMFLYWGPELLCFYNDAFRPSLGKEGKHPQSLGKPGNQFWPEVWHEIGPVIHQVFDKGHSAMYEDQLLPIYRNGELEDVYWTYSFSPVFDESGTPGGVLVTCFESTQKVLTIARLQESQDELSFAIEATELGMWDVNPVASKLKANKRLKEWFGLAADEEVDLQTALDVIADKDRQRVIDAIQRANQFSSGGHYDIEYAIIDPATKKERIVRAKGRAWFNKDKEAYRFNGTLQDITTTVLARKQKEESQSRFRNMIEQAPVAIGLTRGRGHVFEDINPSMLRIIGREHKNEVIGRKLTEAMPELEGQAVLNLFQNVLDSGKAFSGNEVLINVNFRGNLKLGYYNLSYTPLIEDGYVTGIIHAAVDVTEQVLARKKLEESEQRIRSLIESAPFPICVCVGEELRVQFANQAMLVAWGKGNHVIGSLYTDFLPELEEQQIFEQLRRVYRTGVPFHKKNQQVDLLVNGKLKSSYFNYSFVPLTGASGNVYGIMQIAAEVTDLIVTRQQLEEREKELAASNEELQSSSKQVKESNELLTSSNQQLSHINADMDNFIYTASHDLRAPISNIEGLMNAIKRNLSQESKQSLVIERLFGLVTDSIDRFKRTINDLSEITKIQREIADDDATVDLAQIIKEVQLDLRAQIEQNEAQFDLDLQACEPINFSTKNARSIVYNLISNAVKYRSLKRPLLVQITCFQQDGFLVLQVNDNGLGMDLTDKSKIFAMFKRLHDHVGGSGVGLYIVKKILDNAGGKIEVESKVDEGTSFRVYFRQSDNTTD